MTGWSPALGVILPSALTLAAHGPADKHAILEAWAKEGQASVRLQQARACSCGASRGVVDAGVCSSCRCRSGRNVPGSGFQLCNDQWPDMLPSGCAREKRRRSIDRLFPDIHLLSLSLLLTLSLSLSVALSFSPPPPPSLLSPPFPLPVPWRQVHFLLIFISHAHLLALLHSKPAVLADNLYGEMRRRRNLGWASAVQFVSTLLRHAGTGRETVAGGMDQRSRRRWWWWRWWWWWWSGGGVCVWGGVCDRL